MTTAKSGNGHKDEKKFVTLRELSAMIGKAYGTLFRAVKAGKIKSVKFGGSIRISKEEVGRITKEGY